jgi:bis(5'-nucleosidyl)-tetraphosphatase
MKPKTLSAGVVVVRQTDTGCRYLLLRVFNYWDFPKGVVEPGEVPLGTACREVQEETGIIQLDFRWGKQFQETRPYGAAKVARFYIAHTMQHKVELSVSSELGRPEHDEFRWVTYGNGLDLLTDRLRPVLMRARRVTGCGE